VPKSPTPQAASLSELTFMGYYKLAKYAKKLKGRKKTKKYGQDQ